MTRHRSDITVAELALAYELRQEGCCWKRIAHGLNCDDHDLRSAVGRAVHVGIQFREREWKYGPRLLDTCMLMRSTTRFSWRSIAAHFGIADHHNLRLAAHRRLRGLIDDRVTSNA